MTHVIVQEELFICSVCRDTCTCQNCKGRGSVFGMICTSCKGTRLCPCCCDVDTAARDMRQDEKYHEYE